MLLTIIKFTQCDCLNEIMIQPRSICFANMSLQIEMMGIFGLPLITITKWTHILQHCNCNINLKKFI